MSPTCILLLLVLNMDPASTEEAAVRPFIFSALDKAKKLVDEAYLYSRVESLSRVRKHSPNPADVLRLLKQPAGDTRMAVRAADYLENTIRLIKEKDHRVNKRSLNATNLLTPEEMNVLVQLTGCAARVQIPSCSITPNLNRYRTATGVCNNLKNPRLGAANTPLARWLPPRYDDHISEPVGWDPSRLYNHYLLPMVREVSNRILNTSDGGVESDSSYSALLTYFGQWNDHDLTSTPTSPSIRSFSNGLDCSSSCVRADPCFPISIPEADPRLPAATCIPLFRSAPACGTGLTGHVFGAASERQQMNAITAFLDMSQVYGNDDRQALNLRNLSSNEGLLRVNERFRDNGRELLPAGSLPSPCANRQRVTGLSGLEEVACHVAGDRRVDENIALTSLHVLFLREHNRLARALRRLNPSWSSETLYQESRKIVGAIHQVMVFRDYLPLIVGSAAEQGWAHYPGYSQEVDPSIANVFATAAYRFAHLTVHPIIFRLDESYSEHQQYPSVPVFKALLTPWRLIFEGGVDPVIRGMVGRPTKLTTQDHMMVDGLREKLFQFTSRQALDLGSLNIQRGRDHALPGYNAYRKLCGLSEPKNQEELALVLNNTELAQKLLQLYGTPDNIDVWLGGVCEPFVPGGRVGPLFACLINTQFQKIRQGDRLWWQNDGVFTPRQREALSQVSLSRIICDNTGIQHVPANPFLYTPGNSSYTQCNSFPLFDLSPWNLSDASGA